jgi:anti-anti-sigma factor
MQSTLTRPQASIVRPCGPLNAANVADFQTQLTEAVHTEHTSSILIDMSQVESLDSAGLMALVSALNLANVRQKRLNLCAVPVSIRLIFELTQLDRVFKIFENFSSFEATLR